MSSILRDPLNLSLDDLIAQRDKDWQGSDRGGAPGLKRLRPNAAHAAASRPLSMSIKGSTLLSRRDAATRHNAPYGQSSSVFSHLNRDRERDRERDRDGAFRKPAHTYECAFKFLLPNHLAGTLIGNGGSSVRELMDITEAGVHVAKHGDFFPGTKERAIYITGNLAAVNLAQSLVWEMIGQQTHAAQKSHHSHHETAAAVAVEWDCAKAKASPGEYDDVSVVGKITIPAAAGGLIIGRGGATVRSLATDCSVEVKIDDKEDAELTQERVITLNGSVAGCMKCTSLILHKLKENSLTQYLFQGTGYGKLAKQVESGFGQFSSGVSVNSSVGGGHLPFSHSLARERGSHRERDDGPGSILGRSVSLSLDQPLFDPRMKTGVPAETLSANTTIELAVPDNAIGAVLGPQGTTLNEIISLSGAKVVVSKRGEFVEGTTNRLVTIVGSPACAQTAHTLIIHKLKQAALDD